MQPTILAITLVIMAVTLVLILRAIVPTTGPEPDADAPKMRTRLIWVMIVFVMVLSVISLRDWPHASAGDDAIVVNITSLAAESMYDHPHQWGSKRTGPDLARIGGKYSDDWHVAHLERPRALVPGSVMPGYAFLSQTRLETDHLSGALSALSRAGVPYSNEQIAMAEFDAFAQADQETTYDQDLFARYGENVLIRDFDGDPNYLSEMDALVAYLQMLGTLVNFDNIDAKEIAR